MQWFYAVNGQQNGPVEQEVLFSLAREDRLKPDDLVWNATMGNQWAKASTVPGLFEDLTGTPEAAAPPPVMDWSPGAIYASQTPNRDLMSEARACLTGNWGLAIGVIVANGVISGAVGAIPIVGFICSVLISGPFALGVATVFLALARTESPGFGMLFDGFKRFGTALGAYWLMLLFTLLWCLLLIVPGIIAALSYSMTYFIIRDDPSVKASEAIGRSKQMMQGNKWKYFCLQWRFFGWALLCILTLGIGFLWLAPYVETSNTRFYEDLRASQQAG